MWVQLIIEDKGVGKFVTMNRPRVLNCINLSMVFSLPIKLIVHHWLVEDEMLIICLGLVTRYCRELRTLGKG